MRPVRSILEESLLISMRRSWFGGKEKMTFLRLDVAFITNQGALLLLFSGRVFDVCDGCSFLESVRSLTLLFQKRAVLNVSRAMYVTLLYYLTLPTLHEHVHREGIMWL